MNNQKPMYRRSIRLRDRGYTECGMYYVTLCTADRRHLFGQVVDKSMILSSLGAIVDREWLRIEELRESVWLDEYVVMPDHFHGIVVIGRDLGAASSELNSEREFKRKAAGLASILAGFKATVTSAARAVTDEPDFAVWQRNYYERIIRGKRGLENVRRYIIENPANWHNQKDPVTEIDDREFDAE